MFACCALVVVIADIVVVVGAYFGLLQVFSLVLGNGLGNARSKAETGKR